MKLLGVDYGEARTGLAITDETGIIVRPLGVLKGGFEEMKAALLKVVEDERVGEVIIGLPLLPSGRPGRLGGRVAALGDALRETGVKVQFRDERMTSVMARRLGAKASEDEVAACILLEGFLSEK